MSARASRYPRASRLSYRARIAVAIIVIRASVAVPVVVPAGITVPVVVIVPSISVIISTRESVGILSCRFPKFWMILEVGLQLGMTLHVRFIVDQLRILPDLIGDFAMAIEELIEVDALLAHAFVFAAIITGFLMHERFWIFFQLLANRRVLLHEALQGRVIFGEFIVIYERGILSDLFGNLAVRVKELIKQASSWRVMSLS